MYQTGKYFWLQNYILFDTNNIITNIVIYIKLLIIQIYLQLIYINLHHIIFIKLFNLFIIQHTYFKYCNLKIRVFKMLDKFKITAREVCNAEYHNIALKQI